MHAPRYFPPRDRTRLTVAAILLVVAAVGCAGSQPLAPTEAGEESQGWTDANQSDAGRVWIIALPGATISGNTVEVWIDAASGNERDGRGADQVGSSNPTNQTPTGTFELPLIP